LSVPTTEEAAAFLSPLKGRVALASFHDKDTKMRTINFLMACASKLRIETRILDTDAFCSTLISQLSDGTSGDFLDHTRIVLPANGFDVGYLPLLISSKTGLFIIDDLNSLFSLASVKSESHRLFAIMKIISYHAKMNKSWVIATAYRSDWNRTPNANQRSLESLADLILEGGTGDLPTKPRAALGTRAQNRIRPPDYLETKT